MDTMKFIIVAIILTYVASGCGKSTDSNACTLTKVVGGTQISCPGSDPEVVTNGTKGSPGATGPQGSSGSSCSIQQIATGALITCGGWFAVINSGSNGVDGADGKDGVDATPVTVQQLCEGTPTYPSIFVEDALCINDKLYAVYSANGGFLSYLPPGEYSSNGIGSRCNFSVDIGCQITEN